MNQQQITKDMTIAKILEVRPDKMVDVVKTMTQAGLHCGGCEASPFETLEQGVIGHGMSEDVLQHLLTSLNAIIEEKNEAPAPPTQQVQDNGLTLTPAAVARVKDVLKEEKKEGHGLRISVLPGGCSGSVYDMRFQEKAGPEDITIEQNGVNVFVDKESADYLKGVEIDFVNTLNESGFKFNNPNALESCGCGKSFT